MATNMYKKYTEAKTREWNVGSNVQAGTLVIVNDQIGVTLTASGGTTKTDTLPNGDTWTHNIGGVGNKTNAATVATDGTWLFTVAGVSNGETVGGTGTAKGTKVYRVSVDGSLTLTSGGNTLVGTIDDGVIVGGVAPVQIGAI